MENSKEKSRKLSVYQYFQALQVEWIVADLRARIYPQEKDKRYWNKVKEGKQRVIESIAEKNMLPTIFTDDEMKRALENRVYKNQGIPNFQYKNDEHQQVQQPFDLLYYYSKDADVRFEHYGLQKIGKIKSFNLDTKEVIIIESSENEEYRLPAQQVTRII